MSLGFTCFVGFWGGFGVLGFGVSGLGFWHLVGLGLAASHKPLRCKNNLNSKP